MTPEVVAERITTPEIVKVSPRIMLQIANGEFDTSQTASFDKNLSTIARKSFESLEAQHKKAQEDQAAYHSAHAKKYLTEELGWTEDKITPEILRHMHMRDWATIERMNISLMLSKHADKTPEIIRALGKLKITIPIRNGKPDTSSVSDQLYKTTGNITGISGEFYNSFCSTGNINQKLLTVLNEQEIIVLEDFLTDTLGSPDAFKALLATKQTQEAIAAKHDFTHDNLTSTNQDDETVLIFFQNGEKLLEKSSTTTHDTDISSASIKEGDNQHTDSEAFESLPAGDSL